MQRGHKTILSVGLSVLAVAVVSGGVYYLGGRSLEPAQGQPSQETTVQAPRAKDEPRSSPEPAQSSQAATFEVTHVPAGFAQSERTQSQKNPAEGAGPERTPVESSAHYNNLATDPSGGAAAFHISATPGVDRSALQERKGRHPEGRWVDVGGHQALYQPPTSERALTVVTWLVDGVQMQVIGRGMKPDEVLSIARGVRVP